MSNNRQTGIESLIDGLDELSKAIIIAVYAHGVRGQKEKLGSIYALHPLRVMLSQKSTNSMAVGVLHDVLEDCNAEYGDDQGWTIARLRSVGLDEAVLSSLALVSKAESNDESYLTFCARAASSRASRSVKIADIEDNMNITRLAGISPTASDRLAKYLNAYDVIKKVEIVAWTFDYQLPQASRKAHEAKLSQALHELIPLRNLTQDLSDEEIEEDEDGRVLGHYFNSLADAEEALPECAQVIEEFDQDIEHPFTEWHNEDYFYSAKLKSFNNEYGALLHISYDDNWSRWEVNCVVLAVLHEDCDDFGQFLMRFFASIALKSAGNDEWAEFLNRWVKS